MRIKALIHKAEEGGYWAEVPAIPGCAMQRETMEELLANLHEVIEACLALEVAQPERTGKDRISGIALCSRPRAKSLRARGEKRMATPCATVYTSHLCPRGVAIS